MPPWPPPHFLFSLPQHCCVCRPVSQGTFGCGGNSCSRQISPPSLPEVPQSAVSGLCPARGPRSMDTLPVCLLAVGATDCTRHKKIMEKKKSSGLAKHLCHLSQISASERVQQGMLWVGCAEIQLYLTASTFKTHTASQKIGIGMQIID